MHAYLSIDFQRMYESTWHISRNTLSRPFQIDVRFLHFHRISICVYRVTDLDEQLSFASDNYRLFFYFKIEELAR